MLSATVRYPAITKYIYGIYWVASLGNRVEIIDPLLLGIDSEALDAYIFLCRVGKLAEIGFICLDQSAWETELTMILEDDIGIPTIHRVRVCRDDSRNRGEMENCTSGCKSFKAPGFLSNPNEHRARGRPRGRLWIYEGTWNLYKPSPPRLWIKLLASKNCRHTHRKNVPNQQGMYPVRCG